MQSIRLYIYIYILCVNIFIFVSINKEDYVLVNLGQFEYKAALKNMQI